MAPPRPLPARSRQWVELSSSDMGSSAPVMLSALSDEQARKAEQQIREAKLRGLTTAHRQDGSSSDSLRCELRTLATHAHGSRVS